MSILAVVFVVTAAVLSVLWDRSGRVGDTFLYAAPDRYYFLKSVEGTISIGVIEQLPRAEDSRFSVFDIDRGLQAFIGWPYDDLSGRSYFGVGPETSPLWEYSLPYWLPVVALSIIPIINQSI